MRPGHLATLVDLSRCGIGLLVATRLQPGASIEVIFRGSSGRVEARGRVVRCEVFSIKRGRPVRYRAGAAFDRTLELGDVGE